MRRNQDFLPVRRGRELEISPWNPGQWMSPSTFFGASPWQMMRRMQEDMDRVFSQFFGEAGGTGGAMASTGQQRNMLQWAPSIDISETANEWMIEVDLPGVQRDNIEVHVQDHALLIRAELREEQQAPNGPTQGEQAQGDQAQKGQTQGGQAQAGQTPQRQYHYRERRYGFFQRAFPLPENANEQNIRCEFQNGVLTVHIPKMEQARQQRQSIPISGGTQGNGGPVESRSERREPAISGSRGGEAGTASTGSGETGTTEASRSNKS